MSNKAENNNYDPIEYSDEEYFQNVKNREEARFFLLKQNEQKINQHILYLAGLLGTIITFLNLQIHITILINILINCFILMLYVFSRLFYWSTFNDYVLTIAPKKPDYLEYYHQDNLLSRYYWAVNKILNNPDTARRKLAKLFKLYFHIIYFILAITIFNILYWYYFRYIFINFIIKFL